MAMTIERPNVVKVFASDASHGNYLPVKFGTNIPVPKDNYAQVANDNFEYGLESLENDLQMKDLNSAFFYHGNLLGYLFQQGVPEFSAYQNYPMGAVVTYKGNLWIATKDIKASVKEPAKPAYDPCNPCSIIEACEASQVCVKPEYPSKETGWCAFVTKCEYDIKIAELEATYENKQTIEELTTKLTQLEKQVNTLGSKEDKDTVYDDTEVKNRLSKIEEKLKDTIEVSNFNGDVSFVAFNPTK